jgi:hypothetical protein
MFEVFCEGQTNGKTWWRSVFLESLKVEKEFLQEERRKKTEELTSQILKLDSEKIKLTMAVEDQQNQLEIERKQTEDQILQFKAETEILQKKNDELRSDLETQNQELSRITFQLQENERKSDEQSDQIVKLESEKNASRPNKSTEYSGDSYCQ